MVESFDTVYAARSHTNSSNLHRGLVEPRRRWLWGLNAENGGAAVLTECSDRPAPRTKASRRSRAPSTPRHAASGRLCHRILAVAPEVPPRRTGGGEGREPTPPTPFSPGKRQPPGISEPLVKENPENGACAFTRRQKLRGTVQPRPSSRCNASPWTDPTPRVARRPAVRQGIYGMSGGRGGTR